MALFGKPVGCPAGLAVRQSLAKSGKAGQNRVF
jgi:hypothetical protein